MVAVEMHAVDMAAATAAAATIDMAAAPSASPTADELLYDLSGPPDEEEAEEDSAAAPSASPTAEELLDDLFGSPDRVVSWTISSEDEEEAEEDSADMSPDAGTDHDETDIDVDDEADIGDDAC